ncbi:MAG: hypothetical protein ACRDKJ_03250 [Actinomycetota bacterium]
MLRGRRFVAAPMAVLLAAALLGAPQTRAAETERFGDVEFPRDEHIHLDGWDFWWGAADIVTTRGNRYTVGIAMASVQGYGISGHQVFAWQGPYKGSSILTQYGPPEWGHPNEATPGRYYRRMSNYVDGVSDLLRFETIDLQSAGTVLDTWKRKSLDGHDYRFTIDDDAADIHPAGKTARLRVDLRARMRKPPLLAGGEGTFWYGIPQALGYPSRSFQYMQASERLSGTLEIAEPGGKVVRETVRPSGSSLVMIHEYDASPEDLPAGLALALATQLHPRYPTYYQGGMPWELLFADLRNGAQLFVALIAFPDTERGVLRPVPVNGMRDYYVIATLRLPNGKSVLLDDRLRVEHLSYRTIVGRVPTFMVSVKGIWKQAWTYRVRFPGGKVGSSQVPAFDLGFASRFRSTEPLADAEANAEKQRVPFVASGSWDGCAVDGFAWSEVIVNWYQYEKEDPWFTGGRLPRTPTRC